MATLRIEVVYALPEGVDAVKLAMPSGATVADAVHLSGVLERHPGIDLAHHRIGIYGKVVSATALLRNGDRVELYRPLAAEPKEARRRRVSARRR